MKVSTSTPNQSLNAAYRKEKVSRQAIDRLKTQLPLLLDRIGNPAESEENHKQHFMSFLQEVWYREADCLVATKGRIDAVIHDGPRARDPVSVMIEAKRKANRGEMFHPSRPNVKGLQELVLYFLRERAAGNTAIKTLMITDADEVYLFADREFERLFWEKKRFRQRVLIADADAGKTNDTAYGIIRDHITELNDTLYATALHLTLFRKYCEDGDPTTDDRLLAVYKILSPPHLLRRPFANDSNKLDKGFYRELLHIIGLEEVSVDSNGKEKKNGGKKIIQRVREANRQPASLLENVLDMATTEHRFRNVTDFPFYGNSREEREVAVALELCITWVNRVLFLKLLESQLVGYHGGDERYRFLSAASIPDYDALNVLFFQVLAVPADQRKPTVANFGRVPYLNSSLFEITELENEVLRVNSLRDQLVLPLAARSVLGTGGPAQLQPLHYLFAFLDAYDFTSEGKAKIQEENKRLINASVLGLIFEKINGYRDGSFYTPGFITEYMCRETIRRAVVQRFRADTDHFAVFDTDRFADLRNYLRTNAYQTDLRLAANRLVNGMTICDPAVGSGHFLVSALNELIALKSELGILGGDAGAKALPISASVENDELILTYRQGGDTYEYQVQTDSNNRVSTVAGLQEIQEAVFHEKRVLIENCLFGVDLNPNSVKICRLRLWIELLKHTYYRGQALETLPNIDINIKQGNSLVSKFRDPAVLKGAFKRNARYNLSSYRQAVATYQRTRDREEKQSMMQLMDDIRENFRIGASITERERYTKAKGKLEQLQGALELGDLFGTVSKLEIKKAIEKQQRTVDREQTKLQDIEEDAGLTDTFEWLYEFPAVLDEEGNYRGFDVIVGNPPYVRQEELAELKPYLKKHYQVYAGTADLLVYFIELSLNNLREGGQFAFIVSNKFMRAGFGKALRRYIPKYRVHELLDFGDLPVFDEATTYPLIIMLEKSAPTGEFTSANLTELHPKTFRDYLAGVTFTSLQEGLTEDGWNLADAATQQLLAKLKATGTPLGEYVNGEIYYGIKTGYNKAFVIDAETSDRLIAEDPASAEIIKPFLAGRDVKRYVPPVAERYLILFPKGWTRERFGELVEEDAFTKLTEKYPAVANWLEDHKVPAVKRYDQGDYWWELRACDYYEAFEQPKIFYQEIMTYQSFTYDEAGIYSNNKLFIIPNADLGLLGLLNSKVIWLCLKSTATSYSGGALGMQSPFVLGLPVPIDFHSNNRIGGIVQQILTQKQSDPVADTTTLEKKIDLLVYQLYGLSSEEVLIVDPEFDLSLES